MKISTSTTFAATPEQVYAVIADPAYQDEKAANGTLPGSSSTVTPDGEGVRIDTVRVLSSDGLPGFARSVVGDQLTVEESQVWHAAGADGGRFADVEVRVGGAPIVMTGRLALTPTGEGTEQTVDGDLKARIPFLGAKVEEAAAPAITDAIEAEYALIRARL